MGTPEPCTITETKLKRIAWLSAQDPRKAFDSLMHLFNEGSLAGCFHALQGRKAVGIDKVDKAEYGRELEDNLRDLVERMKRMAYRPGPVRQVLIPKDDKAGAFRPLGISNFEDKLVQGMMHKVLESLYEPVFLDCSYGFRPGRGCHDALRALMHPLYRYEVESVIDVDLANYFGSVDHGMLLELLRERIKDPRFLRYLVRMFKAGVLADGELQLSDEGVPQGSLCSPVLANIFAHYVIDQWFEETVKPHCRGRVALFRYCDDIVICCQYETDAQRVHQALAGRLAKYRLRLNETKTKRVPFSKGLVTAGQGAPSFEFLGFLFYWGGSRRGAIIPKVKTSGARLRKKLKRVSAWAQAMRHRFRLPELWARFCVKLSGHARYYGVSHNLAQVKTFFFLATRCLFKWLNRRSQRKSFNWAKFGRFLKANPLPAVRVYHSLFVT
jgi:RNA-directed DNA polymerase